MMIDKVRDIFNQNRKEGKGGIYCICSAHPDVVVASLLYAKRTGCLLSIETTAHQVNQDGGYTGITPKNYAKWVEKTASEIGLSSNDYVLGGDHLGPTSWKMLSADEAMIKSKEVVKEYVEAGYHKIHLDTSIFCDDDTAESTPESVLIQRTIELLKVAENTAQAKYGTSKHLFYVIGTEVPLPGGAQESTEIVFCTPKKVASQTLKQMKEAFFDAGYKDAWERTYGLVLQPGVEYGDDFVFQYPINGAENLKSLLDSYPNLIYEAHSTDYQPVEALMRLVEDHFAILKVGPWLTTSWREALFALDMIENDLPQIKNKSYIRDSLKKAMFKNDKYWQKYYEGSKEEISYKLLYSLSDRSRYYWEEDSVKTACKSLLSNLSGLKDGIPYAMLSQYLPWVLEYQEKYRIKLSPQEILYLAVERVLERYTEAIS